MIKRTLTGIGMALWLMQTSTQAGTVYVNASASGSNNGSTWDNAYSSLQSGLTASTNGDQVWVASGTYYPGTNRASTFTMKAGVNLYGGFFAGMSSIEDRDLTQNITVLSGEIGAATNSDNCYHVITGADGWNGVLDGFTVTRGYAWNSASDTDPARNGGGLCIYDASAARMRSYPTIRNCRFIDNSANYMGGAIAFRYNDAGDEGPVVSNCVFSGNTTWRASNNKGAGIYQYHRRPFVIVNCEFSDNTSYQGAALYSQYGDPVIRHTVFARNTAGNTAGAIWHDRVDLTGWRAGEISDCVFFANQAGGYGGAAYWNRNNATNETIARCWFYGNTAGSSLAGGAMQLDQFDGLMEDCVFSGNTAGAGGGGGLYLTYCDLTMKGLVMVGNSATHAGGAIKIAGSASLLPVIQMKNLLLAGNLSKYGGGAVRVANGSAINVSSCTVADNRFQTTYPAYGGGGFQIDQGKAIFENNILYGNRNATNTARQVWVKAGTTNVFGYNDLEGGMNGIEQGGTPVTITDAGNNLDTDPVFAAGVTGTWSAAAVYTNATGQTLLTDTNANWTPNALAGALLNPNTTDGLLYYIATNSATTISVLGCVTNGSAGASYRVADYHEQSRWGRWTSLGFVTTDTASSPCIDAGDPAAAYALEPAYNGGLLNLGAYGNTAQASKTAPRTIGPVLRIR